MACLTPIYIPNKRYLPDDCSILPGSTRKINPIFTRSLSIEEQRKLIDKFPQGFTNQQIKGFIGSLTNRSNILANVANQACFTDTTFSYIPCPCGECANCVKKRQNDIIQRTCMEAIGCHVFFCTLTYNGKYLPYHTIEAEYTKSGVAESIPYSDWHDLQLLFKRLRNDCKSFLGRPFRYLAVSERGSKKNRPHFHLLFFVPKLDTDTPDVIDLMEHNMWIKVLNYWSRNIGTRKNPIYEKLLTYKEIRTPYGIRKNYDFHLVRPRPNCPETSVAFYVTKYVAKYRELDKRLRMQLREICFDKDIEDSCMAIVKSRFVTSVSFGLGIKPGSDWSNRSRIEALVRQSLSEQVARNADYPLFHDFYGRTFPLSDYFIAKFQTVQNKISLYYNRTSQQLQDSPCVDDSSFYTKYIDSCKLELINYKANQQYESLSYDLFDTLDFDDHLSVWSSEEFCKSKQQC